MVAQSSSLSKMPRGSPGPGKRAKRVPPVPTPQVGTATRERRDLAVIASMSTPRASEAPRRAPRSPRLARRRARVLLADQGPRDAIGHCAPSASLVSGVKPDGVAGVDVEDVAGAFRREIGGEVVDRLGDVLGEHGPLQQRALAVDLFELGLGDLVRRRPLRPPLPLPDLRAAQNRVRIDGVGADAVGRAFERKAAREMNLRRLGGAIGRGAGARPQARSSRR